MIRAALAGDAQAIAAIWNRVIRDTLATFTTIEKTVDGLAGDIKAARAEGKPFLVVEEAGEVVGFATYSPFRGGPGYRFTMEHTVHLADAARGRGLGRALMQALEEHARAAGVHSLWAGISGENPDAVGFHAALGYAQVAQLPEVGHKFGRWMDLVLMQKIL